ncbi:MAG: hypothetical protein JSS36_02000 [Proteobacteria bacterium]|nr:hypothetical protein [Pseudomonadota bacterium]
MAGYPEDLIAPAPPPRRGSRLLLGALLGLVLGGGAVGWVALRHGDWLGRVVATPPAAAPVASPPPADARVAALEARLARLELQASAAAANAGRAEALLTAAAARRAIERGQPLGYLEDQLRQRFGTALPGAVQVVIATSHNPVTLTSLNTALAGLAPVVSTPAGPTGWDRVRAEFSNLFTIRHDRGDSAAPSARLDRARLNLAQGQVDRAIGEVQQLPGNSAAQGWIAAARRYAQVELALDQLETNALTEPAELKDGAGHQLPAPGPLPTAAPSPAASGTW